MRSIAQLNKKISKEIDEIEQKSRILEFWLKVASGYEKRNEQVPVCVRRQINILAESMGCDIPSGPITPLVENCGNTYYIKD